MHKTGYTCPVGALGLYLVVFFFGEELVLS